MDSIVHSDPLKHFCEETISRHSNNWPLEETTLAEEFVSFFDINEVAGFESLQKKFQELGLTVALSKDLPERMYGFNVSFAGQRTVLISEKSESIFYEHILFHEIRELLEHIFIELGRPTAEGADLEAKAENFALHVRMWASGELWKDVFGRTSKIPSNWKRRGVYGLIGVGLALFTVGLILPILEHNSPSQEKRLRT